MIETVLFLIAFGGSPKALNLTELNLDFSRIERKVVIEEVKGEGVMIRGVDNLFHFTDNFTAVLRPISAKEDYRKRMREFTGPGCVEVTDEDLEMVRVKEIDPEKIKGEQVEAFFIFDSNKETFLVSDIILEK